MALEMFSITKKGEINEPEGKKTTFTYLAGVYNRDDMEKALEIPLSKGQMRHLRREKTLFLKDGSIELGYHEIPVPNEMKAWQQTAFRDGISWERERLWNLLCYFKDSIIDSCSKAGLHQDPTQPLSEFSEMILEPEVAPWRYHQKGRLRGAPIDESKKSWEKKQAENCTTCVATAPMTPSELKAAVESGAQAVESSTEATPSAEPVPAGGFSEAHSANVTALALPPARKFCQSCAHELTTAIINGYKTHFCTNTVCQRYVDPQHARKVLGENPTVRDGGPRCPACGVPTRTNFDGQTCWCATPACTRNSVIYSSAQVSAMSPHTGVLPKCSDCDNTLGLVPNGKYYVCNTRSCTRFDQLVPVDPKVE